ncbi:MAG: hypothetical protein VB070_00360 [Clostridiaceae bacterium]|nr:hypothetical protein [Clostridiaceae bacterium]
MIENIRLVAFDLDGTLTQHKTQLEDFNRAVLDHLADRYCDHQLPTAEESITEILRLLEIILI